MKKTILSLAVLIATSVSFSAMAQRPGAPACKADSACQVACEQVLFEGITLTPDQQTKIKAIKDEQAKKAAECRKSKAEDRKVARDAKMNARKDNRKAYLKNMKDVLTPEQYVIFLENAYVNLPAGDRVTMMKGKARGDVKKNKDCARPMMKKERRK